MAKRKQARRKREPTMRTHAQWLQIAHWAEANGDKDKADLIRKLAKERFCAVMCYGQRRWFAGCLTDDEIAALPPVA